MPKKEHAAQQGTIGFFTRPVNRARMLDQLRAGTGTVAGAKAIGIHIETFYRYRRTHPEFDIEVREAMEASAEPVLKVMRNQALDGDTASARIFLDHTIKKDTQQHEHKHILEIDPSKLESIQALEQILLDRQNAGALTTGQDDIVDAEVITEGDE